MRIFFAFMVLTTAALTGCYDMHGRDGIEPPPVPMDDAGEMPEPDAGTMIEPDADVPSEFVLIVDPFYSGWRTPPARQDMTTSHMRVSVRRDVEWDGGLMFQIVATGEGCMVRGSLGTEYFRDLKVKDLATGETMMGPASVPSLADGATSTGFFRIGVGDARLIFAGTSLEFAVTVDLAAVEDAPGEFMGCSYEVHTGAGTIIDASAVRFPGGERLRPDQIGGDNEASYSGFTVDATIPDFDIRADNLRQSTILVAGGDVWHNVAQCRVGPDESIASFILNLDGDAADIQEVAIAADGYILGSGRFPSGTDTVTGIRPREPFVVPSDSTRIFQVWVKIPEVVSNATSGGVHDGFPMSGDTFRIGIHAVERYVGASLVSNGFDPIMGNEFVIRRTKLTITRQTLSTTTIVNGTDQDLYRFQVSADAAGPIALRRIGMSMAIASSAGRVCNLRLRRGGVEVAPSEYAIGPNPSLWSEDRCWIPGLLPLTTWFYDETVSGSGNSYTVFGTPEGFVAGDSISITFRRLADDRVITGYLGSTWASTSTDIELDPSPYGAPGSMRNMANLIWSDLSEAPHSWYDGGAGGSRDWTNGFLIEDLTQTQTLSR